MSESAPAPVAKKKGLSPLAWIGIGCLGLLLISGLIFFSCSMFVAKKAKSFAEDFEKNPLKAAAEMAVRLNPDLEIVSTDDEAGTMTIRDKATDRQVTLNFQDVADGRFSLQTDEGEMRFDATRREEGGIVSFESSEGETTTLGATGEQIPNWVPTYPGSKPSVGYLSRSGDEVTGAFSFDADGDAAAVLDFYRTALESDGFEVETATFPSGGTLQATKAGMKLSLFLAGAGGTVQAQGSYTEQE